MSAAQGLKLILQPGLYFWFELAIAKTDYVLDLCQKHYCILDDEAMG